MEQVVANGNFYKQRIEQLVLEPRELDEADRRRLALEAELAGAMGELGRLEAMTQEGAGLDGERLRLLPRVRELEATLERLRGEYDQARHHAVAAGIRELEPLALQAERLRALADRGAAASAELAAADAEHAAAGTRVADLGARLRELGYTEQAYRDTRDADAAAERARREAELALVRARGESGAAADAVEAALRRRAERA
jgi:multidrug resistance efflux pump